MHAIQQRCKLVIHVVINHYLSRTDDRIPSLVLSSSIITIAISHLSGGYYFWVHVLPVLLKTKDILWGVGLGADVVFSVGGQHVARTVAEFQNDRLPGFCRLHLSVAPAFCLQTHRTQKNTTYRSFTHIHPHPFRLTAGHLLEAHATWQFYPIRIPPIPTC